VTLENGKPGRVNWSSAKAGRGIEPLGGTRQAGGRGAPHSPRGTSAATVNRTQGGRVRRVIDEWRVAGRWWATELRRDYYLLELDGGMLIELYREGEQWCVTGIAD
jgi:hypothetical protein